MRTARYWALVAKLAWQETRRELVKAALRVVITAAILLTLIHFGASAGLDRIAAVAAVAAAAVLTFVWRMITVPAQLHREQEQRDNAATVAHSLEELWNQGKVLLADSARNSEPWYQEVLAWEATVEQNLRTYDGADRLLFATNPPPDDRRYLDGTPMQAHHAGVDRLKAKLSVLSEITARVYRGTRHRPEQPTS